MLTRTRAWFTVIAVAAALLCVAPSAQAQDADGDGVPDSKDNCPTMANPTQADCNDDGVGDACEIIVEKSTGNMGAFGAGVTASGTLSGCLRSVTAVTITVEAIADLNLPGETATLTVGGVVVSSLLFQAGAFDCPATPDQAVLTMAAVQWNGIVDASTGGNIAVTMVGSALVSATQCAASALSRVSVRYGNSGSDCDCNQNGILDSVDIANGTELDCDASGIPDSCELASGTVPDCNANGVPDSCDVSSGTAPDCNANGVPDACDIASGTAPDCNGNGLIDPCEVADGSAPDCNANSVPDSCDIASGTVPDCNTNGVPDACDIASGTSNDVEPNGVPDECKADCNGNGLPDAYELAQGLVPDCNANSVPDSCDIAGASNDVDLDGIPDECQVDCNSNGVPDPWDLSHAYAHDCNANSIPDTCDIAAGDVDKDQDTRPDSCEYGVGDFDLNGVVDAIDLAFILTVWGEVNPPYGDLDGNGIVAGGDLAEIFAHWGTIPWPETQLPWGVVLEQEPNAEVVTNATLRAAITATGLPWRVRDNASNIEMLLVPAGIFTMGCSTSTTYPNCNSHETPLHQVTLSAFYMGRYEVTQAQWTAVIGSNPSYFQGQTNSPSRSVERASWNMIAGTNQTPPSFMSVTGLRLPTEAEWEYAYRAGTTTAFHSFPGYANGTNDDTLLGNIAWNSGNNGDPGSATYGTKPVGGKFANALGLHDMSGNVWEWCQDLDGGYSSEAQTNPIGPATGSSRVLRGGTWNENSYYCRASGRYSTSPDSTYYYYGFRVVRTP